MKQLFPIVDVDLGADHDRHARHHRRKATVHAAGEQEGVDDERLAIVEEIAQAKNVKRTAQARLQAEDVKRHTRPPDLFADRPGFMDARHHRLEAWRQVSHEVQHDLFGAADGEGVREVEDSNRARHQEACNR